ncbi:intermembrane transport protein PqiB [Falsirhodobacter algicola]|uniref:MCE family protein n=1 Tax=Falsirhodobacter algicola TaxID=2692330 RepID=A0A8J8MRQ9_9RHOB|nr:MlaD family protein [Falsirhodobacter algicola]QUS35319.1 MCE family protein [Falsirhodobacter algicola]
MTDLTDTPPPAPPEMEIRPPRRHWWNRISIIWLVPVLALIVAVIVAVQSYTDRGTLITVSFDNASGIEAGQTAVRYRDVVIGTVESVNFSSDLGRVEVNLRVASDIARYIDADAQFWVVRPEVSVRGISGLDTVLSGAYIAGNWDAEASGEPQREFKGLEAPPLQSQNGTTVTLRLRDGNQISAGAPIIHKGIEVGSVGTPRLADDGNTVLLDAVIRAPYDKLLTTDSRFWDASGFDITLGATGIDLDVRSLAALIEGGINFDTIVSGGETIKPGEEFFVYPNEADARSSVFTSASEVQLPLSIVFDGSVAGLIEGAEVRYNGATIGRVTDLGAIADTSIETPGVRMLANLEIDVSALGLPEDAQVEDAQNFVATLVRERNLRARLATASLFTGSLMVELVEQPDAAPAELDLDHRPFPLVPTAPADITEFQTTAQGVINRIGGLPVEELMQAAIGALSSIQTLAGDPETRRVPEEAAGLIADARALLTGEDVSGTLANLRQTTDGLRDIADRLQDGQAVENLVAAIQKANTTLEGVQQASAEFPQIAAQLRELSVKANDLQIQDLADSTDRLLQSANGVLSQPGAERVPAALANSLSEIAQVLAEVREGGAIGNANEAIAAAQRAADSIRQAADDLPALTAQAAQVLQDAGGAVSGYGSDSRFNVELVTALRSLQEAADSVTSLARAIQRNPNSIILGR